MATTTRASSRAGGRSRRRGKGTVLRSAGWRRARGPMAENCGSVSGDARPGPPAVAELRLINLPTGETLREKFLGARAVGAPGVAAATSAHEEHDAGDHDRPEQNCAQDHEGPAPATHVVAVVHHRDHFPSNAWARDRLEGVDRRTFSTLAHAVGWCQRLGHVSRGKPPDTATNWRRHRLVFHLGHSAADEGRGTRAVLRPGAEVLCTALLSESTALSGCLVRATVPARWPAWRAAGR